MKPGPSRATAGPGKTFSRGPSGKKIFEFFFQNGTLWRNLYFWPTVGPPNVEGPGIGNPIPHPLDGPV